MPKGQIRTLRKFRCCSACSLLGNRSTYLFETLASLSHNQLVTRVSTVASLPLSGSQQERETIPEFDETLRSDSLSLQHDLGSHSKPLQTRLTGVL